MPILLSYKTKDTLICYFPNGQVTFDKSGKLKLIKNPAQVSDTCWYDGPMIIANLSVCDIQQNAKLKAVKKYRDETGALYLLNFCFQNFIKNFKNDRLQELCDNPNSNLHRFSMCFSEYFRDYLAIAINSIERKKLFMDHLALTIAHGKEVGQQLLTKAINKMTFELGHETLIAVGGDAEYVSAINRLLPQQIANNNMMLLMQKDDILKWLFDFISLTECESPVTPMKLYELLETSGPIFVKTYFGLAYYKPDSEKCLSTLLDMKIMGWDKSDYICDDMSVLHALIIVGVTSDSANPEKSRVYFLDPNQTLNPFDKFKQIYSVSFTKFMSKVDSSYLLSNYNCTAEHKKELEESVVSEWSALKGGFFATAANQDDENLASASPQPSFQRF